MHNSLQLRSPHDPINDFTNDSLPSGLIEKQKMTVAQIKLPSHQSRSGLPVVHNSYNSLQTNQQATKMPSVLSKRVTATENNDYKPVSV